MSQLEPDFRTEDDQERLAADPAWEEWLDSINELNRQEDEDDEVSSQTNE